MTANDLLDWLDPAGIEATESPSLLLCPDRIQANIDRMLQVVDGCPGRLRPHVKTHKLGEVVRMQVRSGIRHFKGATPAELEMAASAGAGDVLAAFQPVGPNLHRLRALADRFPETVFGALVDDAGAAARLSEVFRGAARPLRLYLDIDCGMHRSGIEPGEAAVEICRGITRLESVEFGGLHIYDGHIRESTPHGRVKEADAAWAGVAEFLDRLEEREGIVAGEIVAGGSPTFPIHARRAASMDRIYRCSPGTVLLWDAHYGEDFPDLGFVHAAALLTRVVSRPGSDRLCLDLGHKAVAAENPMEKRVRFPALPEARAVTQSEEYLVLQTPRAQSFPVGTPLLGLPWHICPTVALHEEAILVRNAALIGERWTIHARNRGRRT